MYRKYTGTILWQEVPYRKFLLEDLKVRKFTLFFGTMKNYWARKKLSQTSESTKKEIYNFLRNYDPVKVQHGQMLLIPIRWLDKISGAEGYSCNNYQERR